VVVSREGTNAHLQVRGDEGDDWRIVASSDLETWFSKPELGTLLSGNAGAIRKQLSDTGMGGVFYRAVKTEGLYDRASMRTVHLTFGASNWPTLLTSGRTTGSNTACAFVLDNGIVVEGAGARYRGNTSFTGFQSGTPLKKSINLDLDYTDSSAEVMGYKTFNFNNAYGDETVMRESLYLTSCGSTVCPRGAWCSSTSTTRTGASTPRAAAEQ
jgi:hypothetical protein